MQLFFVLSGFLITSLLLKDRGNSLPYLKDRSGALRRFYRRRFLRIFPVYYCALFVAYLAGNSEVRQDFFWHAMYGSNFLIALRGDWGVSTSHFWTLAVEQQFYLFWPLCILFVRRAYLPLLIALMIVSGPLFRLLGMEWWAFEPITLFTLPVSSWDSLGMGALLAWTQNRPGLRDAVMKLGFLMFAVSAVWTALALKASYLNVDIVWMETVRAAGFLWLVGRAAQGIEGVAGRMLAVKPLVYFGKISYGVYVYHLFTPLILQTVFASQGWLYPENPVLKFVLCFIVTLVLAAASWHGMEKPILSLKSKPFHFPRLPALSPTRPSAPVLQTGPVFSLSSVSHKFKLHTSAACDFYQWYEKLNEPKLSS